MSLVNLSVILQDAQQHRYAVGSFNVVNLEFLQAILTAAERKRSPIILSIAEVHFKYLENGVGVAPAIPASAGMTSFPRSITSFPRSITSFPRRREKQGFQPLPYGRKYIIDLETILPLIRYSAMQTTVPVAIHLDHGLKFETVVRALRCGFTSVMFDGSLLPFEENVKQTQEIVKMAHSVGVTVEAELGHVGGAEGGPGGEEAAKEWYTNPADAQQFVERTKVDALAIAIGNAHGLYKQLPKLDFDRLTEIRRRVTVPLVLHGGSGIPAEDFKKSIQLGICKINFYTEMSRAAVDKTKQMIQANPNIISFPDILLAVKSTVQEVVEENLDIYGSSGVCERSNTLCAVCGSACSKPQDDGKITV
ncbi:MAG: class II fructose-bisphosphate aldolase family protein, partial [bacterium]|nr:class II fructose-bisphosphate aldolase family protein [bacterium]